MKKHGQRILLVVLLGAFLTVFSGCASAPKKEEGTSSSLDVSLRGSFYDFEDILIPSEISLDKKKSSVYSASRSKVGLLTFDGRVRPDSLAAFFQNQLPKSGWKLLTSLKDREHSLVFQKDDRICLITIAETFFTTVCQVRVALVEKPPEPGKGAPSR